MKKTLNPSADVEQMSELLDLPLDPEHRLGVEKNFATISAIATLVMEFPIPEEIEAAPVFEP